MALLLSTAGLRAATFTWDPGHTPATGSDGTGEWLSGSPSNWASGGTDYVWTQWSDAIIGINPAANYDISVKQAVNVGNITFNQSGTSFKYTIVCSSTLAVGGTVSVPTTGVQAYMGKGTIASSNALGYVTFTKDGAGTLRLSSSTLVTTANPAVEIINGTLQTAGTDNNLPQGGVVQVDTAGILDLTGFNQTIAALTGSGVVKNSTGTSTLTVGNNGASGAFSGRSSSGSGVLLLTKVGAGTQTMNGTAAWVHTGATTISGGSLIFASGASCANSAFLVNSGAGNTLGVQLATAGAQWACTNLTFGAADAGTYALSLNFNNITPSTTTAPIICSNLTPHSTITLTVSGFPSSFTTLGTYPLIAYNPYNGIPLSSAQFADFSLAPLPSGYQGNLVNDTANFMISLQITTVPCAETVTISPASPLPAGAVDLAYSQTLTGGGGTGPYTFSVISGSLPGGITLDPGGLLSGTTTAAGTFNFTIQVTDTATSCFNDYPYSLTIAPGAIASYGVTAPSPQVQYLPFTVTVTALDAHGNTVTTDSSTQVTMSGSTGNVQFDANGNGTYGDATKTLTAGTFTIQAKDNVIESVNIIATDTNSKTGSSSSIAINAPANLTWDPGKTPATGSDGIGTWQAGLGTWATGGTDVVWSDGANAIIGVGGAAGTGIITFKPVTVANITFNQTASGSYTLSAPNIGNQLTFNAGTVTVNNTTAPTIFTKLTIAGAVTFTKSGAGILALSSSTCTYTGPTVVAAGMLRIQNNTQQLPTTSSLEVDATATFDLFSKAQTVDGLTGSGIVDNTSTAGSSILTIGANGGSGNFSGVLQNSSGTTTLGLTKVGAGTQTLSGASTYGGNTTISGGTLALGASGSIANSARIIIGAGGTFDVSAIASYAPGSATTNLYASGTGTALGTTAAAINGGTTVDFTGVNRIVLTNDSVHPSLYIAAGTLALNDNTFYVYNDGSYSVLADGDYTIIEQASGSISGTVAGSVVTGSAVVGKNSSVSIVNGAVMLHVCTPPGAAGTITGPGTATPGDAAVAYSITPVTGATSYTWTAPVGASIASGQGTAAITVNYACGFAGGNVGVTPVNSCANGTASSLAVTANPALAAQAGPPATVCAESPVTLGGSPTASGGAGSYSYSWASSPAGFSSTAPNPSVSPTTTTTYTVTVTDANGCTAQSPVTVTVNPLPGTSAISGPATVNANQSGVGYSVTPTAGSTYAWTVPSGASITAGQGTSAITVTFGTIGGNVAVTETSAAGCVGTPVSLSVTVQNLLPVTISSISYDSDLNATVIDYAGGAGSQFVLYQAADVTTGLGSWTPVQTNAATPGEFSIGQDALSSPLFWIIKSQ